MILIQKVPIRPILVSLISFLLLILVAYKYGNYQKGLWENDVKNTLQEVLISKKSNLEKALYSRIYYTKGIAAYVSLKPHTSDTEFNILAHDLISKDTNVIGSMSLSKDCIIGSIYPLKGHEAAIGLDLMKHPERKEIVKKTIDTRKTFVAGPVELIEGGTAFISYTPIFDKTKSKKGIFWGLTDIVILMEPLLKEAGIIQEENEIEFSLRGYNGSGHNGEIFYGKADIFKNQPVSVEINLPYGHWLLAAVPKIGWNAFYSQDKFMQLYLVISSFIISILMGLVYYNNYRTQRSEKKLKAIFKSLDSLIFEFNKNGIYKDVTTTKLSLLLKPAEELIGKSVKEVFDEKIAQQIMEAIQHCIATQELVIMEYPILLNHSTLWFQGRISYKSSESVIFNAIDITENKRNIEKLKQSEANLKKLNGMKNKFFAVLSHDLRNSLGSFMEVIQILVSNYSLFSEEDKKNKLEIIYTASKEVNSLLENILEWQIFQSGSLAIELKPNDVNEICQEVMNQFKLVTNKKQIEIINNIPENTVAFYHPKLCSAILRNILSNAIKFSHTRSIVKIYCHPTTIDNKEYLTICIEDDGIGMQKEKIDQFYASKFISSSLGTLSEKGTGLGIFLCKEFVEMQGGQLTIDSEIGKGSRFSFTLKV